MLIWGGDANQRDTCIELCLVGRFLSLRTINIDAMRIKLSNIYKPLKVVYVRVIAGKRYLFQFYHESDMKRVLDGGPWSFDNNPLIYNRLSQCVTSAVPLFFFDIWVQVYGIPIGFLRRGLV